MTDNLHTKADNNQTAENPDVIEVERKAEELTRLVYAMSEKRLAKGKAELSPELVALGAAAVALHKSLTAFLAVERLCE